MKQKKNIIVIGAGPAGLMAAETLANHGHHVTVCDRMPSVGRKFLMAGRGGLNLTHSEPLEMFLERYGDAKDWIEPSIRAFPPEKLRAWCEALGQETFIGSSGRIFPRVMKTAPLLRAWLRHLDKIGVQFAMRYTWKGWEKDELVFLDVEGKEMLAKPDAVLLALGGASWPRLGSDGGWAKILEDAGVTITPLRPSNSGFIVPWSDYFSERFAGQPLKNLALTHDGKTQLGEAMITKQGLEGGAIYALSSSLREAITHDGKAELIMDLRPDVPLAILTQKLQSPRGSKSLSTYLRKAGLSPLAIALLREVTYPDDLTQETPEALAAKIKALPVTFTATTAMDRAISTAGGIVRDALDEHFMLKAKPGVFVAGEMIDWEAPTGGYLLQGCFSTAVAAAKGILHFYGAEHKTPEMA